MLLRKPQQPHFTQKYYRDTRPPGPSEFDSLRMLLYARMCWTHTLHKRKMFKNLMCFFFLFLLLIFNDRFEAESQLTLTWKTYLLNWSDYHHKSSLCGRVYHGVLHTLFALFWSKPFQNCPVVAKLPTHSEDNFSENITSVRLCVSDALTDSIHLWTPSHTWQPWIFLGQAVGKVCMNLNFMNQSGKLMGTAFSFWLN